MYNLKIINYNGVEGCGVGGSTKNYEENIKFMTVIKSKRIILRPFNKKDDHVLVKIINDKEVARNTLTIPYPYRLKDARKWINFNLRQTGKKEKIAINFGIGIQGKLVGGIGLSRIINNHEAEIGYWLGKEYRGQGITSEAVKLVTKYAFEKLKLKRVYGYVFPWNKASAAVLKNAGFKYEGLLRKHAKKGKKFIDDLLFAKIK